MNGDSPKSENLMSDQHLEDLTGISYLLDLKNNSIADEYYRILKKSKHLNSSIRNLDYDIDNFLKEIKDVYLQINSTSIPLASTHIESMAEKNLVLVEKSLDFGIPENYIAQAMITFLGNLALDGHAPSIEFVYETRGEILKKNKELFKLLRDETSDSEKFKVIISFRNPGGRSLSGFMPPIFNMFQSSHIDGELGTIKEEFKVVRLKDFDDLQKFFLNFIHDTDIQIDTKTKGQRLFFARRYLAGISQVSLSKQLTKKGRNVSSRSIGNWEESNDDEPLWFKKYFSEVNQVLYEPLAFLIFGEKGGWSDTDAYGILNDWLIYGDSKENRNELGLPQVIKNFTFIKTKEISNQRKMAFNSYLELHDWKNDLPPRWYYKVKQIDDFWLEHWTRYFQTIEEKNLFNIMDLLRLTKDEQDRIHKIFWFIRVGNEKFKL